MAKKTFLLRFYFDKPLSEQTVRGISLAGRDGGESFFTCLELLRNAVQNHRVAGVLFIVRRFQGGWAQAEEIMALIRELKKRGKKAFIFLERADNLSYYLSSSFDLVFMPPASVLELVGLRMERYFLRNLLEFIGIQPELINIGKYKSAGEGLMREGMSEPAKEALSSLLDDLNTRFIQALSAGRNLPPDKLSGLIDKGPWSAGEAEKHGLIDAACYEDQLEELLKNESPGIPADAHKKGRKHLLHSLLAVGKPKIALIGACGKITEGSSRQGLMGNQTSGARTLCKQFQEVRKKKRIKAVILRIDSPGGSAAASDLIWREIYLTARQKPVICSMGNTAASGGYYIAAAANHILASPATITGSIGVVGGKFDISGLLEKLKIKTESIQSGARAGYSSLIKPLNSDEQVAVRNILKNFYEKLFLKKVGIKLKKDSKEVKTLAEGRVWTGAQALHLGMVDSEGGLIQAFELACSQAGIPSKKARLSISSYRSRLRDIIPSRSRSTSTRILAIMPSCLRVK